MIYVNESGIYRIMFSCQEANIPGTAPHAFIDWVTEEVLPSIRRNGRYELQEEVRELKAERGRRLWIVFKQMDQWSFNARRKYFGPICRACAVDGITYVDQYDAPHVSPEHLERAHRVIAATMAAKILAAVPENQRLITDWLA